VQVSAGPPPPPQAPPRTFSGPALPGGPPRGGSSEFVSDEVSQPNGPPSARPLLRPSASGSLPPGWEKTGRNEPCPCGSGKKFKKCHGANL
jgi:preprotein translocase subunit SecA